MTTLDLVYLLRERYYTGADLETKQQDSVFLKCAASLAMMKVKGATTTSIGKEIGLDHSSITHYKLVVHPQMMSDDYYAACYLDACQLVREDIAEQTSLTMSGLYGRLKQLNSEARKVEQLIQQLASE